MYVQQNKIIKISVFTLCFLCLPLMGCLRTIWQKDGATQSEYEQTKASCMLEGYNLVPQDNRTYLMADAKTRTKEKCKNKRNCTLVTKHTPPQYGVRDQNLDLRQQMYRACLYRNGWNEVVIED